jgi:hypothetical protein
MAGPLRDVRGFVAAVVYHVELDSLLLAQSFALTPQHATEIAERVAWGFWRNGLNGTEHPRYEWQQADQGAMFVHPYAPKGAGVLARATEGPDGVVFVVGHHRKGMGALQYGAACADLGLITGPARWDHRSQYTTLRRVPTGDGWSSLDAIDEAGALPQMKQRRKGPAPVAVLRALADESA